MIYSQNKNDICNIKYETLLTKEFLEREDDIIVNKSYVDGCCTMHAHEFIEIAYIVSGKGIHSVCGKRDNVTKGDLFILNAHVSHEFTSLSEDPLLVYNYIFQPLVIDSSFRGCDNFVDIAFHYLLHTLTSEDAPKDFIKLTGIKPKEIDSVLEEMYLEYNRKEDGYKQVIKSDLIKLLILVFRLYKKDYQQEHNPSYLKKLIVQNAIDYLKEHYPENIKCNKLAERAYMSLSYFCKVFKEVTGMTVIQMLQDIRIDAACTLLESTGYTIMEVAETVGYSDLKYFYKIFYQKKSLTPGQYREKIQ